MFIKDLFGSLLLSLISVFIGGYFAEYMYGGGMSSDGDTYGGMRMFVYVCVFAPIWEEIYFRYVPFKLAKVIDAEKLRVPTILFTSIWFGLEHGGPLNILIQGVFGIFLANMYLKHGLKGSISLHFLYNLIILINEYYFQLTFIPLSA